MDLEPLPGLSEDAGSLTAASSQVSGHKSALSLAAPSKSLIVPGLFCSQNRGELNWAIWRSLFQPKLHVHV